MMRVRDGWQELRLWNIAEVSLFLGKSERTIYNTSRPGAEKPFPVKPKRVGRLLRWDRREIEAYVDQL
jgi:predicted DNA-binding transcriptional regulator AlpA